MSNGKIKNFEQIENSVVSKIYPYLISDLNNIYNNSLTDKTILEIGTGPGFIMNELTKIQFHKIYGIDISLDTLIHAEKRLTNPKAVLINSAVENLPFKSNKFDIVFSRGSLFFWKDLEKAFSEIIRVTKPNGMILIGGGYGISTPDTLIEEINEFFNKTSKSQKPKVNIDQLQNIISNMGYKSEIIAKPKHGFWIKCIKSQ